jgi:imidazolonepropionase-like amidohydrolase
MMIAITNAKIYINIGKNSNKNTILIKNGKFVDFGYNLEIGDDIFAINAHGKFITVDLIEAHTHLGIDGIFSDGGSYTQ